jgi:hypothetical protein
MAAAAIDARMCQGLLDPTSPGGTYAAALAAAAAAAADSWLHTEWANSCLCLQPGKPHIACA